MASIDACCCDQNFLRVLVRFVVVGKGYIDADPDVIRRAATGPHTGEGTKLDDD